MENFLNGIINGGTHEKKIQHFSSPLIKTHTHFTFFPAA